MGAKCRFGINHREIFASLKNDLETCFFVNMRDHVECLEDLGLVDPLNDEMNTLLKSIEADKYDSDREVYFKTG